MTETKLPYPPLPSPGNSMLAWSDELIAHMHAYVDADRAQRAQPPAAQPGQHTHADQRLEAAQRRTDARFASALAQPADQGQAALREALQKLVDLQDMRERAEKINPVEPGYEKEILMDLYRQGIRAAWHAARRAIATPAQSTQTAEPKP